jgi:glycosyltransferase involved in cell wall biosynthesis
LRAAVASALAQEYPAVQVLVSDNASPDGVAAALSGLEDPRLEVRRRPERLDMAEHWDACLRDARGAYVVALSDDDRLLPGAVAALVAAIVSAGEPFPRVAYGPCRVVAGDGRSLWTTPNGAPVESAEAFLDGYLAHDRVIYPCATMMDAEALRAAGGYHDRGCGPVFDVAAFMRAAFAGGRVAGVAAPVADYTEHVQSFSRSRPYTDWAAYLRALGAVINELVPPARRVNIARRFHAYAAYFLLDLAMKGHYGRLRGAWSTLCEAIAAQATILPPAAPRAALRMAAKLAYLAVAAARR